jgi:hypothetical protein
MTNDNLEPEHLRKFLDFLENYSGDFPDLTIVVNGKQKITELLSTSVEQYFIPICEHGSQSLICYWRYENNAPLSRLPIVWLDSEGSPNSVFASNIDDFLSLLPYNTGGIYDFISSWQYYNSEPDNYSCPTDNYDISTLESMINLCRYNYTDYNQFMDWLGQELNIQICQDPAQLIREAINSFPNLDNWLEKHDIH